MELNWLDINLKGELTVQEIILWALLILMAYYPPEPLVNAFGYKVPIYVIVGYLSGGNGHRFLRGWTGKNEEK